MKIINLQEERTKKVADMMNLSRKRTYIQEAFDKDKHAEISKYANNGHALSMELLVSMAFYILHYDDDFALNNLHDILRDWKNWRDEIDTK